VLFNRWLVGTLWSLLERLLVIRNLKRLQHAKRLIGEKM
jgi:hypothetical protein